MLGPLTENMIFGPGDMVVVGIGASAGGLDAMQDLIAGLSTNPDRAYVLVQHLDPDHQSLLPELLSRRTKLPVKAIQDGMAIEQGHIYLIPPAVSLTLARNAFKLTKFETPRGQRRPIDTFLQSLAQNYGIRSACIILSGTGSDGSMGARAINEAGGIVLVQDPKQSKYDGMPKSAIATNVVDMVLPVQEMIGVLDDYFSRRSDLEPAIEADAEFIDRVMKHVRYRTGHDFAHYKKSTLMRRLARRMSIVGVADTQQYLQRLISDPAEATRLFHDVLINVTSFFRDADAFEALRVSVLPHLMQDKGHGDEIRVWIPGCSTGQEAYTIAMLLVEEQMRSAAKPRLSVFATDIDSEAVQFAREAVYPTSIAAEVPHHFLERYFNSGPHGFKVSAALREIVRLSNHSVIKDPPFSKLDLISCRNLLIYFENSLQEQTLNVFQYALKPSGYLLLGPSEGIGNTPGLFKAVNSTDRLFRRLDGNARPLVLPLIAQIPSLSVQGTAGQVQAAAEDALNACERAVLSRHTPPFVMINEANEVTYSSGRVGRFLELPAGRIRLDLIEMAKLGLKSPLRSLLAAKPEEIGRPRHKLFDGEIDEQPTALQLSIEKLSADSTLIVFQDRLDQVETAERRDFLPHGREEEERMVRELEDQLEAARQTIRTTVEELETSNEELKSSNEEMMSMNEELQSANEELTTINDELQNKIQELNTLNDDQRNLIESTQIATIFLDSSLCIRSFTPEATKYFRLVDRDVGRPFGDIVSNLSGETLLDACRDAIEHLAPQSSERRTRDADTDLLIRVYPYKTKAHDVDGVVVTLTDITALRSYARQLEEARTNATLRLAEIEELYRVTPQAKALLDRNLCFLRVNQRMAEITHLSLEAHVGRRAIDVMPELGNVLEGHAQQVLEQGNAVTSSSVVIPAVFNRKRRVWDIDWYPVRRNSEIYAVGVNIRDITPYRDMEVELRRVMRELQHRVKNMLANVKALVERARRERGDQRVILDTLVQRIRALGETHNLLTAQNWRPTPLFGVLRPELTQVYGEDRISLNGPAVDLSSRATLALSMAIHELATNAAKYGSLSVPGGRVDIVWVKIDEGKGEQLVIRWQESKGPSVKAPERTGFGTELIRMTIEASLSGSVQRTYESMGYLCTITIPYDIATEDAEHAEPELKSDESFVC